MAIFSCQPTKEIITKVVNVDVQSNSPRNIILFIGDGMGLSQISALHYRNKMTSSFAKFPVVGIQSCYSADNLVTDSAASGTAMACGKKTKNGMVGLDKEGNPLKSIIDIAESKDMATGIVVSSSITDATPASFYAHKKYRGSKEQIALDLIDNDIDYIVGGGKKHFVNTRTDGRDLIQELTDKSYVVHDYKSAKMKNYDLDRSYNYLYFTAESDPPRYSEGRKYLKKACLNAISFLEKHSDHGYVLIVEGSQIDWAGHKEDPIYLMDEMREFDETVDSVFNYALQDSETLVIVTADHETGGLSIDGGNLSGKMQLEFSSNRHSGAMVPVFAMGPGSTLFGGMYDNTDIFKKMKFLIESPKEE